MTHIVNALAVFRLTYFCMYDLAPFELMAKVRDMAGIKQNAYGNNYGTNEISKALACQWCCSLWVGLFVAKGNVREALAYSGVTGLLFKVME